jgi:hypothetical protein
MVLTVSARRCLLALRATLVPLAALSCGDRTGLLTPLGAEAAGAGSHRSALDAGDDAGDMDALPLIDVARPRDVANQCPNAAATLVYVITTAGDLMTFFPPTATFATIGRIACPAPTGYKPFSMGVDRTGVAYVLFTNQLPISGTEPPGQLFRVSTATAACRATGFVPGQQQFSPTFGMGFSADSQGTGETLYVASNEGAAARTSSSVPLSRLAWIDTGTFALHIVGTFPPNVNRAELTGTGAGDLFAFYAATSASDSVIGQVDKATARVTGQSPLAGVNQGDGWAFAFWGGDFYTFTAPSGTNGPSVVTRFRPNDGSIVQVARTSETVVGAGVSTCAPQQ